MPCMVVLVVTMLSVWIDAIRHVHMHTGIYTPEHTYLTYTYTHCPTNVLKTPCIDSINNFFELFIYLTCAMQFECAELYLMCNHHSLITRDTFVSFCCTQTRSVTKGSQRLNWTKPRLTSVIVSRRMCVHSTLFDSTAKLECPIHTSRRYTTNLMLYSRSVLSRIFFILIPLQLLVAD